VGKKATTVKKDVPGFVLNRLQFAILRESMYIVENGIASIEDVDNTFKYGLGMRYAAIGPFETADLGGLDTFHNIASYLFADLSDRKTVNDMLADLFKADNYGVKSGKGYYDYSNGKDKDAIRRRDKMFIKLARCLYSNDEV
jgi:3-hydroxybutyryl-CoA dehydrogenase